MEERLTIEKVGIEAICSIYDRGWRGVLEKWERLISGSSVRGACSDRTSFKEFNTSNLSSNTLRTEHGSWQLPR